MHSKYLEFHIQLVKLESIFMWCTCVELPLCWNKTDSSRLPWTVMGEPLVVGLGIELLIVFQTDKLRLTEKQFGVMHCFLNLLPKWCQNLTFSFFLVTFSHVSVCVVAGFDCPVCSKFVASDEIDLHLVMCLTKPRLTYNGKTTTLSSLNTGLLQQSVIINTKPWCLSSCLTHWRAFWLAFSVFIGADSLIMWNYLLSDSALFSLYITLKATFSDSWQ